jgi:hypothetical protein
MAFKIRACVITSGATRKPEDIFATPKSLKYIMSARNNPTLTCQNTLHKYVGFEVLTAVVVKSSIFWDIRPHIPLQLYLMKSRLVTRQLSK